MARVVALTLKKAGSKTAGCTHNTLYTLSQWIKKKTTQNSEQILLEAGKRVQSIKF